jgi:hypothetical protein
VSTFPTDRLLQEYNRTSGAIAFITQVNAQAEFATKERPATVDADAFAKSISDMAIHANVKQELVRRGVIQSE